MMTEKTLDVSQGSIIWARMHGFAPWPARICSAFERKKLLKQKMAKGNDHAVTFFGMRNDSGWIPEGNISLFNSETWKTKFDKKKFKTDKNYRAGILEAALLTKTKGLKYPAETTEMLAEVAKEFQEKMNHLCSICAGSNLSGDLTTCIYCDVVEIHWHCFHPDDPFVDDKFWICDNCCKANKLPKGSVFTREKLLEEGKKLDLDAPSLSSNNAEKDDHEESTGITSGKKKHKKPSAEEILSFTANHNNGKSATKPVFEMLSSTNKGHSSSAHSMEEDILTKEDEDVDDQCFVCGQDGELLMCDFPDCPRVYHPVCIVKIAPRPLTIDTAYDGYHNQVLENGDDNIWFCPKHFCTICGILEANKFTSVQLNQSILLPPALFLHAKELQYQMQSKVVDGSIGEVKKQKTLWELLNQSKTTRSCRSCPFTICTECEQSIYPHCQIFKGRRGNSHHLQCRNCLQPTELVKLAKLLENAWVKIASSRLALPFLRPLLPISSFKPNSSIPSSSFSSSSSGINHSSTYSPIDNSFDLLLILEHIHSLKYHSAKEFEDDLFLLRELIHATLYRHLLQIDKKAIQFTSTNEDSPSKDGPPPATAAVAYSSSSSSAKEIEEIIRKHPITKVFYDSFETIFEAGRNYLFTRELLFKEVEEDLWKKQEEEQNAATKETPSSSSNAVSKKGKRGRKRKHAENNEETAAAAAASNDDKNSEDKNSVVEPSEVIDSLKVAETEESMMVSTESLEIDLPSVEKTKHSDDSNAKEEEEAIQQEERLLQKLWRIFCHKDPLRALPNSHHLNHLSISSPSSFTQLYYDTPPLISTSVSSSSSPSKATVPSFNLITARSIQSWKEYLQEGMIPSQYIQYRLDGETPLSNQSILQIRNQLLLNDELAFSKGPKETNEISKFNLFDDKYSKKLVKQLLFFHEDDEVKEKAAAAAGKDNKSRRSVRFVNERNYPNTNLEATETFESETMMEEDSSNNNHEGVDVMKMLREEEKKGNEYLQNEYDVANLLLGMQQDGNNARENVTMSTFYNEPRYSNLNEATFNLFNQTTQDSMEHETLLDPQSSSFQTMLELNTQTPIHDESFVILNHLQTITEQTLALQMKLKQEYLRKQQQLFQYNHDVVTFGELRLVQELKLANDNLKWRLEQKSIILSKYKEMIQRLQLQLKQSEDRVKQLEHQHGNPLISKEFVTPSPKANDPLMMKESESQKVSVTSMIVDEEPTGKEKEKENSASPVDKESDPLKQKVSEEQSEEYPSRPKRKIKRPSS